MSIFVPGQLLLKLGWSLVMKKFLLRLRGRIPVSIVSISMISSAMIFVAGCVTPDQYQLLENRIAAVEMDTNRQMSAQQARTHEESQSLENLELRLDTSAKVSREQYAEIKYEIEQIKGQFRQIEGLIEEINHNFGTNRQVFEETLEKRLERLDNAISRNYERVINLERYMGFEPGEVKPADADDQPLTASTPEAASEEDAYLLAKKMFDDGDKENARIQFENFINKYPDSKNADNARFWIADSYYAEKWYEKAILEYQRVLENYPDSNKTAAARLKQGYSFAELGETANARLILKELIKRHPDSNEAKYAQKKLKSLN
jgi:tol-pal system protein YbgF